jgi:hypothetical protein
MSTGTTGGGGTATFGEFTQPASPGILLALSCFCNPPHEHNFQTFVSIGVKVSDARLDGRNVELASGYIREEQGITWTGLYPLKSGDLIYMFLRGNLNPIFQLVDKRLTPDTQLWKDMTIAQLFRAAS